MREIVPPWGRPVDGGFELKLKVVPGASRSEVVGPLGGRLKVRVAAPAESGRANRAVLELIRGWTGARRVVLVSGRSSAQKVVRVEVSRSGGDQGSGSAVLGS